MIDPAADAQKILSEIDGLGLKVRSVIDTHGHIDHVTANDAVRKALGVPLLIHPDDEQYLRSPDAMMARWMGSDGKFEPADRYLEDGQKLEFGDCSLQVIHTPGHTPGGVSLYGNGLVFTGDTLFHRGVGRTDLPGGNQLTLERSIRERLFTLPEETIVYPGHGPSTTIGEERTDNPYV